MRTGKLAIVPAHNEERSVGAVVTSIRGAAPDFDIVVIDDGSNDATAARAHQAGAVVISHPFSLGIGGAMQSGYRYAMNHEYELTVQVDGDGQHDASRITHLIQPIEAGAADMVCGTRFTGISSYRVPFGRRIGIHLFASILSLVGGQRLTDPTCGFRACNRRVIELFAHDYPHDYPEVEAIMMLKAHRLRMHEMPVRIYPRRDGHSSITLSRSAYYMVKVLLALFVALFRRRPVVDPEADALLHAETGS